jgi:hypothetical protein
MSKFSVVILGALLLLCMLPANLSAQDAPGLPSRDPGQENPPSQFVQDLRRFEIIAFGTLPFTLFFANVGYDVVRYGYYGFSEGFASDTARTYQPLLFGDRGYTNEEKTAILISAAGASLLLATVDLIIEKNRARRDGPR